MTGFERQWQTRFEKFATIFISAISACFMTPFWSTCRVLAAVSIIDAAKVSAWAGVRIGWPC